VVTGEHDGHLTGVTQVQRPNTLTGSDAPDLMFLTRSYNRTYNYRNTLRALQPSLLKPEKQNPYLTIG